MRVRVAMPAGALGTVEIIGWASSMPRVGDAFIVWPDADAIEPLLHTADVVCILERGYFVTRSGAYRVEVLADVEAAADAIARRAERS